MKATKSINSKENSKQQHCPVCNLYVKFNEKLPNYICKRCVSKAQDKSGLSIAFFNITNEGNGCQGKYVDSDKLYRSNICYIKGVKCQAVECVEAGIIIITFKRDRSKVKSTEAESVTEDLLPV